MSDSPNFDTQRAHQYFSVDCFNAAWGLIEKPARSVEDDQRMIQLAQASLYHWSQRDDCTDKTISIGYWQLSRVYAVLGEAGQARHYAELCLEKTPHDESFFLGYAYEALARAEFLVGNLATAQSYLTQAWANAESVTDDEEKKMLTDDLESLA